MNNPKKVYEALNLAEAELVKGLLQTEEISSTVQEGALEGILGEMAANAETLPSVWVNDGDYDRALAVVDEYKRNGPPAAHAAAAWICPRCGEKIEGQFSSCWKCNTARTAIA
jgi:hypothetical protein